VELIHPNAETDAELEAAYQGLARVNGAALVSSQATHAAQLVDLAARHRVPSVYGQRAYAEAGGLLSYGASVPAGYVVKGLYAGRILKGAKPADLPVQLPSKFELVLNLKTAQVLGISVPQSILLTADDVIE
jgi:putative ABC transport system substrate-binding protein